jgi:hypothetical protein
MAHRGERRPELVRHGRDEVGLKAGDPDLPVHGPEHEVARCRNHEHHQRETGGQQVLPRGEGVPHGCGIG